MGIDIKRVRALSEREQKCFTVERPRSRKLAQRGRLSMPNGVPMEWMAKSPPLFPIFVKEAQGAYFTDVDGHHYLDFEVGDEATLGGHSPQPVVEAIARCMQERDQYYLPSEDAIWVAEELRRRFGLPFWQFTHSATTANIEEIRLARAATHREKILLFDKSYHGHLDDTLVGLQEGGTVRPTYKGLLPDAAQRTIVIQFNDLKALEAALAPRDIACVLVEPTITNIGVIHPDPGFHSALRELTRRAGTLLIIDETQTIICGPGGLTKTWGLKPDMLTLGKSIGGGVPLGAYGMTSEISELIEKGMKEANRNLHIPGVATRSVALGGTLFGGALAMAGARAYLEKVMTDDAYRRMNSLGKRLADGIDTVIKDANLPWHAQRLFAKSGYWFSPTPARNGAEAAAHAVANCELYTAIWFFLANRGIWASPDMVNMFKVCAAASSHDIDFHTKIFKEFVEQTSI